MAAGALYIRQDTLLLVPPKQSPAPGAAVFAPAGQYIGEVHEPAGPVKGTIVYFHGNAGIASSLAYAWRPLTELGYRAVLMEYPGFGARAGAVDVAALSARSVADFDLVRKTYPAQPVMVAGESFGAGVAAAVAGARPAQVCGVLLLTPWNRLSDLVQEKLPMFPAGLLLKATFPSDTALQAYAGPVTIIGAERDTFIPVHHARTLAGRHAGSSFEIVPDADHNNWHSKVSIADWRRWLTPSCARGPRP